MMTSLFSAERGRTWSTRRRIITSALFAGRSPSAYTRIRDALAILGHEIGRNTVKRILFDHGIAPAPERSRVDAPICQDSRSRSQVCGLARSVVCHHALKNLAGEKACETADDLPFGPPFSGASFDVVEGW